MADIPDFQLEAELWQQGALRVAGVDEVGRGPLAGPLLAAAVVLPPHASFPWLAQVRDSKLLSAKVRSYLAPCIRRAALVGLGSVAPEAIDELGVAAATRLAMLLAVEALPVAPHHLLVDGLPLRHCPWPHTAIVHGDAHCLSIACASIVAKVERDRLMSELADLYPGYGFARHKGYPTPQHRTALVRLGPSPIHRRSYAPVRALLEGTA